MNSLDAEIEIRILVIEMKEIRVPYQSIFNVLTEFLVPKKKK